jgi:endonuclease/exonuclease/phosphatase family metal-dependent hydrolase
MACLLRGIQKHRSVLRSLQGSFTRISFRKAEKEFRITTTHLKAKKEFAKKHLARVQELLSVEKRDIPQIILGDFNATPDEECVQRVLSKFKNKYEFTTIKFRDELICHTIDYVFYHGVKFDSRNTLNQERIPILNSCYPSDHLMICTKFVL